MQSSLLEVANMKSYHTPSVPRKHARLQVWKAPRLNLKICFPRPSRCPLQTQKRQCQCRSRNRSRQTLDSLTLRTKKEGESDLLWVSSLFKILGREVLKFQNVLSQVFRFRSENESLAISPVRNHPGLALYQDLSVLSESTTSRFILLELSFGMTNHDLLSWLVCLMQISGCPWRPLVCLPLALRPQSNAPQDHLGSKTIIISSHCGPQLWLRQSKTYCGRREEGLCVFD